MDSNFPYDLHNDFNFITENFTFDEQSNKIKFQISESCQILQDLTNNVFSIIKCISNDLFTIDILKFGVRITRNNTTINLSESITEINANGVNIIKDDIAITALNIYCENDIIFVKFDNLLLLQLKIIDNILVAAIILENFYYQIKLDNFPKSILCIYPEGVKVNADGKVDYQDSDCYILTNKYYDAIAEEIQELENLYQSIELGDLPPEFNLYNIIFLQNKINNPAKNKIMKIYLFFDDDMTFIDTIVDNKMGIEFTIF